MLGKCRQMYIVHFHPPHQPCFILLWLWLPHLNTNPQPPPYCSLFLPPCWPAARVPQDTRHGQAHGVPWSPESQQSHRHLGSTSLVLGSASMEGESGQASGWARGNSFFPSSSSCNGWTDRMTEA